MITTIASVRAARSDFLLRQPKGRQRIAAARSRAMRCSRVSGIAAATAGERVNCPQPLARQGMKEVS